jgi:hypothetical protein
VSKSLKRLDIKAVYDIQINSSGAVALMSLVELKSLNRRYKLTSDVWIRLITDKGIISLFAKEGFVFDGRSGSPLLDWYAPNLGSLYERIMWLVHDLLGYATCLDFKTTNKVLRYGLRDQCGYRASKAFVIEKCVSITKSWFGAPKKTDWCYNNISKFNVSFF